MSDDEAARALRDLDRTTPNLARVNDYFLGGKDNFAVDRETGEALLALAPEIKPMAEEMVDFRRRVVHRLASGGVRRFIDLGSGLPTRGGTHQIAHLVAPDARVVYVNDDLVVLAHARALLGGSPGTAVVDGSVLEPEKLLEDPAVRALMDGDEPVAVLALGILQFIPEISRPREHLRRLMDAMPSGSHLGLAHVVFDERQHLAEPIVEIYTRILSTDQKNPRTTADVARYFEDLSQVPPGLVPLRAWHPDNPLAAQTPDPGFMIGGLARKP